MDTLRKRKFETLTHTKRRKPLLSTHNQQQNIVQPLQYICGHNGCNSTFKCQFNLVRHRLSIHGSKRNCPREGCHYATGRKDKLKEHIRRMHSTTQEFPRLRQITPVVEVVHHHRLPIQEPITTSFFDALKQQDLSLSTAFGSRYPPRGGYEIYPRTEASSLDVCMNDPHASFFGAMMFDRLCIETTIPNPSGLSTETDFHSLPQSPVDFNGVGGWVPPTTNTTHEIYPEENDADDEKEYETQAKQYEEHVYYEESDGYYSGSEGNDKEIFPAQEYVTLQEISFRS